MLCLRFTLRCYEPVLYKANVYSVHRTPYTVHRTQYNNLPVQDGNSSDVYRESEVGIRLLAARVILHILHRRIVDQFPFVADLSVVNSAFQIQRQLLACTRYTTMHGVINDQLLRSQTRCSCSVTFCNCLVKNQRKYSLRYQSYYVISTQCAIH